MESQIKPLVIVFMSNELNNVSETAKISEEAQRAIDTMEVQKRMAYIAQIMKEIPYFQSDIPQDSLVIEKVEIPEGGGIFTYMQGKEYPYKGFPYIDFVDNIDKIKKIGKAMFSGLYHNVLKGNKLKLLTLIPCSWLASRMFRVFVYAFYRLVERFRIKPIMYCQAMREVYKQFSTIRNYEMQELQLQMRDLLCMVLEFDNAYRYRFQDLVGELNQQELVKNPIKELKRIIQIAQSREIEQQGKDMWTLIDKGLINYLIFDKKIREMLVGIFSNINIEEVKLQIDDQLYAEPRKDYKFGFQLK